jgi:hypothetical protein
VSTDRLGAQAALIEASAELAASGLEASARAAERLAQSIADGRQYAPAVAESQMRTEVLERALQARQRLLKLGRLSPEAAEALQHQMAAIHKVLGRYDEAGATA